MREPYIPDDEMRRAAVDTAWLRHWREIAQERLARKRVQDTEVADLRIRIALIDAAIGDTDE